MGAALAQRLAKPEATGGPWAWALGRVGARDPVYGSVHRVVPAELAAAWLRPMLAGGLHVGDGTAFASVQLARRTGDRSRDLPEDLLVWTVRELQEAQAPEHWVQSVREVVARDAEDEAQALGESLPAGLSLNK